ncbi:hypothetical protein KHA93_19240 [Bacillus sp. FJAT-49732]|uniref:Uncharacterized protein n=1 Tax=Lederbergia citrisecunda TaxID=2833583 RepID=A0A942TT69_9BACI|nr:hypothetical protein [Lederbergia citrisecunda]MBS4201742.1 hypothetical protein [Lederbergia citrisecunda]
MRNLLMVIVTAGILFGTVFLRNGQISQNAIIFVGIIVLIMLIYVLIASKLYPVHSTMFCISICGFSLLLFVPCLVALTELKEPLESATFIQFLLTFIIAPIIYIGSVILAYRRYFIIKIER